MDSLQEIKRRLRTRALLILVIVVTGVIGFSLFEKMDFLNAIWMTIITLTTIGYGDIVPQTTQGRIFNLLLILIGIGSFAYAFQAVADLITSPVIRDIRMQRRVRKEIAQLQDHLIICGEGQIIDHIAAIMQRVEESEAYWLRQHTASVITTLLSPLRLVRRRQIGKLVVITTNTTGSAQLPSFMRVLRGSPTSDEMLLAAGIERASAMMITLNDDAQSLLTVLTARQYNSDLQITCAILNEEMRPHVVRAGASTAILPYEIGGQILNMATLRPAVSDFFNFILFNLDGQIITEQFHIDEDSPCRDRKLGSLDLTRQYDAGVIALMQADGSFLVTPPPDHILQEDEVILVTGPLEHIPALSKMLTGHTARKRRQPTWQHMPVRMEHPHKVLPAENVLGLEESQDEVNRMSHHFVICADGHAGREAVDNLDPERPFVIITNDERYAGGLLQIGFHVVLGNPIHQEVLQRAGVDRALALMVTQEDEATSILTVLTARSLSRTLNITAAADTAFMENKLKRAGADRIAMPFQVAAEFIFMTTIRPVIIDFFQYVVFNRQDGIETTELYMQDDSPFIGKTIAETGLHHYQANAIGVRRPDGHFTYAPPADYALQPHEVLIVVAPMAHTDELRNVWRKHKTAQLTSIRPK